MSGGMDDNDRKRAGVLPHDPKDGTVPFEQWEREVFPPPPAHVPPVGESAGAASPAPPPTNEQSSATPSAPDHAALVAEVVAASRSPDPSAVDRAVEKNRAVIALMGEVTRENIVTTIAGQAPAQLKRKALSKSFERAAKPQLRLVTDAPPQPVRVVDLVPGAPVDTSCVVPPGFRLSRAGIEKLNPRDEWVHISPTPVVITETSRRLDDGREQVTAKWIDSRTGHWLSFTAGREVVSSRSNIVSLAAVGFPVTTTTASGLVDYLHHFLAVNAVPTPRRDAVGRCGWISEDRFALGAETIGAPGTTPLTFTADGPGEADYVEGLREAGDFETWRSNVGSVITKHPIPGVALYSSLASPFLMILKVPNFIVHLGGDSTKGKSTSQAVGASAWGDPTEGKLLRMWSSTAVGIERLAALSSDIGLFLDEAQTAEEEFLVKVVYSFASGAGKNRGAKIGTQASPRWRSILLSSGEKSLESGTAYRGAGVRVLTFFGRPFGDDGVLASNISKVVGANHGFAGPMVVRALIDRRSEWSEIREQYKSAVERWAADLKGDTSRRRAQFIAVLEVAAKFAHEVLGLPGDGQEILKRAAESLVSPPAEETFARAAFNRLYSYAVSNRTAFYGKEREVQGKSVPPNKYLGDWTKPDRIAFFSEVFEDVMRAAKADPRAALSAMAENGWVQTEGSNNRVKVLLPDGARPRMVVIAVRTGAEAGEPGDATKPEPVASPASPSPDSEPADSGGVGHESGRILDGSASHSEDIPF